MTNVWKLLVCLHCCFWLNLAAGSDRTSELPAAAKRVDAEGIPGALVICGGGALPDAIVDRFISLAGGEKAKLILIPTAAEDSGLSNRDNLIQPWKRHKVASIDVLHTRSHDEANQESFVEPLKQATAVWFGGGQQSRIAEAYVGTAVERELMALLGRDGVIGGTSAGAAIQSRLMIAGGNPVARTGFGFDLLPDAVIDQHFLQRNRKPRLIRVIAESPGHIGFGVDEETALVVRKRSLEVVGSNKVTVCLGPSSSRPAREFELTAGGRADLTALRRAARDRMLPPFPAQKPAPVSVPNGSLFIVGGGRLQSDVLKRFVELSGGPDALIVALPTASENPGPDGAGERRMLAAAGAKNVVVLPGRTQTEVESEQCMATLKEAKGLWFGGGRQWRFVDAYEGTKVIELFHDILRRGGAIGGSSAGASIQAEYMVRGSPLGNTEMMADGYERGFGFLPGAAVDQHFTQRKRHADMEALVKVHPQLLGIGIDEGTVLIVRGTTAEVVGQNSVFFFDRSNDSSDSPPIKVAAGEKFDLLTRKQLTDSK